MASFLAPPVKGLTYHWLPFSRSYGDILPSSFSTIHSRTRGYSPRPPVSVSGTVTKRTPRRGFSRQPATVHSARASPHLGFGSRLSGSLIPRKRLPPCTGTTTARPYVRSCVPLRVVTHTLWCRNIRLLSIVYALRPRLRVRLTRRMSLAPEPLGFRCGILTLVLAYSFRHPHFPPLHP